MNAKPTTPPLGSDVEDCLIGKFFDTVRANPDGKEHLDAFEQKRPCRCRICREPLPRGILENDQLSILSYGKR